MYMTAEMWELGAHLPAGKLALLPVLFFPFLVGLSWHAGFEATFSWRDDVVDALVAFGVGITASAAMLWLLKAMDGSSSWREVVGMVTLEGPISMAAPSSRIGRPRA